MDENDIKNLKNLQFTITESMKDTFIEMLTPKWYNEHRRINKRFR